MKLIALVTVVTAPGKEAAPGAEFDVKDKADAQDLIERGFARPVETKEKAAPTDDKSADDKPTA